MPYKKLELVILPENMKSVLLISLVFCVFRLMLSVSADCPCLIAIRFSLEAICNIKEEKADLFHQYIKKIVDDEHLC